MDTRDTDRQLRCFQAFQSFATTVEGERAFYIAHGTKAIAVREHLSLREHSSSIFTASPYILTTFPCFSLPFSA